ncbi:MAG TPA: carbohydrate kinase family protein [Bacteroidota bacterium]|nr:carbohydrate kinase family protein [Bacteroidota bacterium]
MKFTIIGHLCLDVIHHADGSESRGFGGIYFAVGAMASIASETDTIFPVFGVGEKEFDDVQRLMKAFPNVDASGIFSFSGDTNQVHLFYGTNGNSESRIECSKHISAPVPFSRIEPFLNVQGIFLDMISGFDVTLETLDQIRLAVRSKNVPIHIDLHSLTLGLNSDATRYRRALTEWRRWCFMVNSIQMNEEEAAGLTVEKFTEDLLAKQMLPLMVNALCITRGQRGATMFQQEHKHLLRKEFPGIPTGSKDPTGCGDVFGSAFLYQYCRTKSFDRASEFANEVAAANSTRSGSDEISLLSRFKVTEEAGK